MPDEAQQDPTLDTLDEQQPQAPETDTPEGQEADTDWQIPWAAGLFEGEGCVYLTRTRNQRYVHLTVVSTDEDVIRRFAQIVGVGHTYDKLPNLTRHKHQYQWRCARREEVAQVRDLFLPYLGQRRTEKWLMADAEASPPTRPGPKPSSEETSSCIDPNDSRYVTVNGRRLLRVRGGDGTEDEPAGEEPSAPEPQPQPEGEAPQQDGDWESRYKNLQSEYTRASQENAQFNELLAGLQDPEIAPQILDQLGYQLDDESETPLPEGEEGEYFDPTFELQERLDALEGAIGAQAQEEQQEQLQEAEFAYIDDQLSALEKEHGSQLSDDEANTLGTLALQLRTEEGYPDVKGAFERLTGFAEERRKAYLDQKRQAARAPEGIPGQEKVNLTNAHDRQAAAAKVIEAESDTEQ